ncbi:MAG: MFS transporter [Acidimicrobiales bacterium]|jgi:EmrB/QacA subfamily drug resistance transporter
MPSSIRGLVHERRRWVALIVVCFAMLMNTLDQTIVNVALPTIQHDLHFTQASLAWVIDAYLITFAGALLLAGRLGDLIGRKRVFLVGLAMFTLASAACGAADTQALLVGARFVQGLGAALSSSVILAIIVADFPIPAERAKAMSSYIIVAVGGGSLGLLVGGYVTQALSWHWIFFINIPIGIATFLVGVALIDENVGLGVRSGLDVGGAVLSTGGLMLAVYAIVSSSQYGWRSSHTLAFGGGAIVVLAAFALLESRMTHPMMPLQVMRSPGLLTSSLVRGLMVVGMYSTFFIGVLYFQHVLGFDPVVTGLAFLPQTLMVAVMSAGVTARIMGRFGAKTTALGGLVVVAIGLTLFVRSGPHTAYFPQIFLAVLLIGFGAATAFTPLLTVALAGVPAKDAGIGSGIVNVSQQVSGALSVAVLGAISTGHTASLLASGHSAMDALDGGYRLAFVVALASVLVAIVLGFLIIRRSGAAPVADQEFEAESETMIAEIM